MHCATIGSSTHAVGFEFRVKELFKTVQLVDHIGVKISVIVPAFNEEKLIASTLRTINSARRAFDQAGWQSEVVVCDNNSTDRTSEIAKAEGAVVVFEPINQIARARNKGAEAATGDWFVFVDGDSHPSAELFSDVIEQIQSGKCLAGGSTVKLDDASWAARMITGGWNRLSRWKRWLAGSFIFCSAETFRGMGGFSRELFAGEELELSKRFHKLAKEQGKSVIILDRHPLVTSGRKVKLYTPWEHIRFIGKTVLSAGKTLKTRESCPVWYDGRR
jgi:glycosyltransferase involved in cell wall biosynthesis